MSTTVSFDDVWKTIQELAIQQQETSRRFQEAEHRFQETERLMKESSAEVDRKLKEVGRHIDSLGSRWGEFLEGMVAPACQTVFARWGIPVHNVHRNSLARLDDGRSLEVDVLVTNTTTAVLVEVKSRLGVADVKDHLTRLGQFKTFFPAFAGYRVLGAVAGISSTGKALEYAHNQGLFVLTQAGETLRVNNPPTFKPRAW